MRTVTVGQPGSQWHGLKTKCCGRKTLTGQTLLTHVTKAHQGESWRERAVACHARCLAEQISKAPEGAPVSKSALDEEFAALRALAQVA